MIPFQCLPHRKELHTRMKATQFKNKINACQSFQYMGIKVTLSNKIIYKGQNFFRKLRSISRVNQKRAQGIPRSFIISPRGGWNWSSNSKINIGQSRSLKCRRHGQPSRWVSGTRSQKQWIWMWDKESAIILSTSETYWAFSQILNSRHLNTNCWRIMRIGWDLKDNQLIALTTPLFSEWDKIWWLRK